MHKKAFIFFVLIAAMLLLSACGSKDTPTPVSTEVASEEPEPTGTTASTEVPKPTATSEVAVVSTATSEPTDEIVEENEAAACIDCHANKDLLIETAMIEAVVESENEGEG